MNANERKYNTNIIKGCLTTGARVESDCSCGPAENDVPFIYSISFAFIRVHLRLILSGVGVFAAGGAHAQIAKPLPVSTVTYKDVQPLLKARCVVCHSAEMIGTPAVSGGLALDTYAAFSKGVVTDKNAHPIYMAGKREDSELLKRLVTSSSAQLMPKGGPALPPEQIALFRKWIMAGAPGPVVAELKTIGNVLPVLPMPALVGSLDVTLPTRITLTPDQIAGTDSVSKTHPAYGMAGAGKTEKTGKAEKAEKTGKSGMSAAVVPAAVPVSKAVSKTAAPVPAPNPALSYALSYAMKIGPLPPQTAIAFSPDGKHLAVGGYRAVIVWDTATGQPSGCLGSLAGQVQSLAFRPDGAQLAVGGGVPGVSGEVKIVDAQSLAAVGSPLVGHTDVVFSVAWNAAGTQLATASQDKTARLWDWPSGKEKMAFKDHSDAVTRVCFAPDGKSVYTASLDHNARRFDCADGKVIRAFTGHGDGITALALSPKGDALLTSGPEPEIRWWNTAAEGEPQRQGGHGAQVNDIAWSRDGKIIATSGADHTVRLWDAGNRNQIRALDSGSDWIYAASVSPDGKLVAGAGADGVTRVWETATGRLRLSLLAWPPSNKSGAIEYAAITPEGYYNASPMWAARLRPQLAAQASMPTSVSNPRAADWIHTLRQPDSVAKGWQAAPLEPAKLDAPKSPAPIASPVKPVASATASKPVAPPSTSK